MPRQDRDHILTTNPLYEIVLNILKKEGRDFTHCEECGKEIKRFNLHHTKYDGATLRDIKIVCTKCNTSTRNKGLK